jgi:ferredoxin/mono/diheme cytochrome c family protein
MRSRTDPRAQPSSDAASPDPGEDGAEGGRGRDVERRGRPAGGREPRLVPALERATYRAEAPLLSVVRSHRLNPLVHAGTISVFLLGVVVVTGVYITLFFQFGFEASHRSVERMADHPIQSAVRTVHRYASAALVLTTLVHAWRVFVAGRFRGPRRWRWTSGVVSLVVVWLAGVTGYWLVWDERAQALNEATAAVLGGLDGVATFFVRDVYGAGAGTGWSVLFVIWLAHLLLTVVIGYALWRHVRRTRLRVLPPRHWMAIMLGALVVASVLVPADVLERADPARIVGDLPLDPFVLFLLPPLLGDGAWLAIAIAVVLVGVGLAAPHLVRTPTPVVEIDTDACTGCELCLADCPFDALAMADRTDADASGGTQARRPIAVVDAARCVGCGICVGSCSFGAMELPGFESPERIDPTDRHVVIACTRHLRSAPESLRTDDPSLAVVEVPCSGMVHAHAIGALTQAGATEVQVVGCAPGDCAYGFGNRVLAERLSGDRAPHVPRRWAGVAEADWVAPGELVHAIAAPNRHPEVDADRLVRGRRLIGAVAVVCASVAGVVAATRAPYTGHADGSGVRVLVDHVPGRVLEGQSAPSGAPGDTVDVVVRSDGREVQRTTVPVRGGAAIGIVDADLSAGDTAVTIALDQGGSETVLFDGRAELAAGRRLLVQAFDVPPPPGLDEGREVFASRSLGGCGLCHSTSPGDDGVGPSLSGVADRAAGRVPGMSAEEYLRASVLLPDEYVVDGYRPGVMLPIYGDRLTSPQIDALVEYLLSLDTAAGESAGPTTPNAAPEEARP